MSIDQYKAEAKRLADHLAEIHGIKLKHTSVLSAVAALHGARDWNTLIARQKPGIVQRVLGAFNTPAQPGPGANLAALLEGMPAKGLQLGLCANDGTGLSVGDAELCRHTLVVGPNGQGVSVLMEYLVAQQILRGGGALVLDPQSNPELASTMARASAKVGRSAEHFSVAPATLAQPGGVGSDAYDILASDGVPAQTERLLAGIFPQESRGSGDHYAVVRAAELLGAVLESLTAAGERPDLIRVSQVVAQPQMLLELVTKTQHLPEASERLQTVLSEFVRVTKNGEHLDAPAFKQAYGMLSTKLSQLARTTRTLNKSSRCLDMGKVLLQDQIAYLGLPSYMSDHDKVVADIAVENLVQALHDRLALVSVARAMARSGTEGVRQKSTHPFLLVLPWAMNHLGVDAIRRLMNYGRAANVAMVFHVSSLAELEAMGKLVATDVYMNTRQKVFFRQSSSEALELSAKCLRAAGAALESGVDTADVTSRLAQLTIARALFLNGQELQDLQVQMVLAEP